MHWEQSVFWLHSLDGVHVPHDHVPALDVHSPLSEPELVPSTHSPSHQPGCHVKHVRGSQRERHSAKHKKRTASSAHTTVHPVALNTRTQRTAQDTAVHVHELVRGTAMPQLPHKRTYRRSTGRCTPGS